MTTHYLTRAAAGVLLTAVVVCASRAAERNVRVSGEYFYNFEFAYVAPDGRNEQWCIKGDMSKAELPERWGTTTVEVEGSIGPEGKYGNLGICNRILTVERILKATNFRGRQ
jgi:hypothetical protein